MTQTHNYIDNYFDNRESCMKCERGDCPNEPTIGVRTMVSTSNALRTQVFWDHTDAPKTASLYCHEHGPELLTSLADLLARKQ